jgi:hypothetical protein
MASIRVPRVLIKRSLGQPSLANQQVSNRFGSVDCARVFVDHISSNHTILNISNSTVCNIRIRWECDFIADVSTPRPGVGPIVCHGSFFLQPF